jgi:hypothetical protein
MKSKGKSFSFQVKDEIKQLCFDSEVNRNYVRECFLQGGTISDPNRSYHLEFVLDKDKIKKLMSVMSEYGLNPKQTIRYHTNVVYIKEASEIADILNIMLAHKSLLRFENVRVEKDLRNNLNRKVNFETANLNKTIHAALCQIEAIEYINTTVGLTYLTPPLEEVAKLRLAHDNASLEEIGAMLVPPISKSGVNHRLRKICETAQGLKKERGEKID